MYKEFSRTIIFWTAALRPPVKKCYFRGWPDARKEEIMSAKLKLTGKAVIDRLPAPDPSGKPRIYWDQDLKGFGVLCSGKSSTKSYIAQGAIRGVTVRCTIARVAAWEADGHTVKEARKAAAKKLLSIADGVNPKTKPAETRNWTLQRALDEYLIARPNLSPNSRAHYRNHAERHLKSWLKRPLRDITPDRLETRYRQIKNEVATRQRRGGRGGDTSFTSEPGACTANATLRTLRTVYNFAAARDPELAPWPAARLRGQWFRQRRRVRHIAADDLLAFYRAVNAQDGEGEYRLGWSWRDFILMILFSGLRRNEAAGLRWADVDLAEGVIRLPAQRTKSGRPLDLPMSDFLSDLLTARRARGVEGPFVFPAARGDGHVRNPSSAFASVGQRCGITVSPHDLRRTYATVAATCGDVSQFQLQGLLNHSSGSGITAGYVILTPEALRPAAQAIADKMKEYCGC